MILVTGGAGFIGSNFVLNWLAEEKTPVVNLDKLTYAGNLNNLSQIEHHSSHHFVQGDICNRSLVRELLKKYRPRAIVHFAAESHVDRSIYHPEHFVQTNVFGTFYLLEEALFYWKHLHDGERENFRFLHISTDEVYGSISPDALPSKELSPYIPNSPYAASKASADHFVRAYFRTYGLPTITTRSSNNYGPYQFPEKLIPLMIVNALQGKHLPIYGDGLNIRNWLYVQDHCEALRLVLAKGVPGEVYNIGDKTEYTNRDVVTIICSILDELKPDSPYRPHASLIKFVKDRPGHDRRYSLNCTKIREEIGWQAKKKFAINIRKTVSWYLHNMTWIENVISGEYRDWINTHYAERELYD
jgi:dTDP-glucose 4,6-dehydratase